MTSIRRCLDLFSATALTSPYVAFSPHQPHGARPFSTPMISLTGARSERDYFSLERVLPSLQGVAVSRCCVRAPTSNFSLALACLPPIFAVVAREGFAMAMIPTPAATFLRVAELRSGWPQCRHFAKIEALASATCVLQATAPRRSFHAAPRSAGAAEMLSCSAILDGHFFWFRQAREISRDRSVDIRQLSNTTTRARAHRLGRQIICR